MRGMIFPCLAEELAVLKGSKEKTVFLNFEEFSSC